MCVGKPFSSVDFARLNFKYCHKVSDSRCRSCEAAVAQLGRATDLSSHSIKVEAVNQLVDGSSPPGGANLLRLR